MRVGAGDQRGGNSTEHLERWHCHELEWGSLCKGWGWGEILHEKRHEFGARAGPLDVSSKVVCLLDW